MTSLSTATAPRVLWKKRVSRLSLSTALTGSRVSSSRVSRTLLEVWWRCLETTKLYNDAWLKCNNVKNNTRLLIQLKNVQKPTLSCNTPAALALSGPGAPQSAAARLGPARARGDWIGPEPWDRWTLSRPAPARRQCPRCRWDAPPGLRRQSRDTVTTIADGQGGLKV